MRRLRADTPFVGRKAARELLNWTDPKRYTVAARRLSRCAVAAVSSRVPRPENKPAVFAFERTVERNLRG